MSKLTIDIPETCASCRFLGLPPVWKYQRCLLYDKEFTTPNAPHITKPTFCKVKSLSSIPEYKYESFDEWYESAEWRANAKLAFEAAREVKGE